MAFKASNPSVFFRNSLRRESNQIVRKPPAITTSLTMRFEIPSNLRDTKSQIVEDCSCIKESNHAMWVSNNYFGKLKFHNFVNGDICDSLDHLDSGLRVAGTSDEVKKIRRLEKIYIYLNFLKHQYQTRIPNKIYPSSLRWGLGLPKVVWKKN